ncbi:MAG: hypothetical protein H6Q54_640 [Deltaproteobacteria bacterium]|nr:hypothetical protein [Deltaproteobacteria bacterium]
MTKKRHTIHRHGKQNPDGLGLCSTNEQQKQQIVLTNIITLNNTDPEVVLTSLQINHKNERKNR